MNRVLLIGIVSVLCMHTKAQEKDWVEYPYREISVPCDTKSLHRDKFPMCYYIQTREEFDTLCDNRKLGIELSIGKKKSEINFFKEFVLGVWVEADLIPTESGLNPYFNFKVMYEKGTKIFHYFFNYSLDVLRRDMPEPRSVKPGLRRSPKTSQVLIWIAIQKPIGIYQVHFHLTNEFEMETETRIFKDTQ